MLGKIVLVGLYIFVVALAVDVSTRPKSCPTGTTYKKDCNTCTCAADGKDKCSSIDCSRANAGTTPRSSTGVRPGTCPTRVTPAPGSDVCKKRTTENECVKDNDCLQAKKCCKDGCDKMLCRNAIYNYTR